MNDFAYKMTADEYLTLYKRFLSRPPEELLLINGSIVGKKVLDLCAGTLRLSYAARDLGADVVAVEPSVEILPQRERDFPVFGVKVQDFPVRRELTVRSEVIVIEGKGPYDIVVCQQAVNYWFDRLSLLET